MTNLDALFAPLRAMPVPPAPEPAVAPVVALFDGVEGSHRSWPTVTEADTGSATATVRPAAVSPQRSRRSILASAAAAVVLVGIGLAAVAGTRSGGDRLDLDTASDRPGSGALAAAGPALIRPGANCAINVADLNQERTVLPRNPLPRPAVGQTVTDPAHGTCITRLTDHRASGAGAYLRQVYSRSQAFNADNTRVLTTAENGYWHLIDVTTSRDLGILPGLAGDAEPQWHRTDPDLLFFVRHDLSLQQLNVATGRISTVADFNGRLPWPEASRVWTRAEGSPSADQRWWAFLVETDDFRPLGLMVWDAATDRVVSTLDLAGAGLPKPDAVSMSPSGNQVVGWWDTPIGVVAFNRDFTRRVQLSRRFEHADLALLPNGNDALVTIDYQSARGDVYYVDATRALAEGRAERVVLFPTYLNGSATALHVSGKAFDRPGWALISTYAPGHNVSPDLLTIQWHDLRVFAVELTPGGRVLNLAHHRAEVDEYWEEPHATVNRDFSAVVFASNWGNTSALDVDTYLIDQIVWPTGPTPPPTTTSTTVPSITSTTRPSTTVPSTTAPSTTAPTTRPPTTVPTTRGSTTVPAPDGGEVLFVGNSATHNVALAGFRGCEAPAPQPGAVFAQLGALLDRAGSGFAAAPCLEQLLIGGRTLADHRSDPAVAQAVAASTAAVVVVQPDVYETLGYDSGAARTAFLDNGAWLVARITEAGARPVVMEMWPERHAPDRIATTARTVTELSTATGADVVRVGSVMDRYRLDRGRAAWRALYQTGTHLSAKGTYLAALVHYRYLTGATTVPAYRPTAVTRAEQRAMWRAVLAIQTDTVAD